MKTYKFSVCWLMIGCGGDFTSSIKPLDTNDDAMTPSTGGATSTGGAPGTGGASTGGSSQETGGSFHGTGGSFQETGGSSQTGGAPTTGGVPATGGTPNIGGAPVDACSPVTHDNGLGQTWQDCVPIGTYNEEQATKACKAWCATNCSCYARVTTSSLCEDPFQRIHAFSDPDWMRWSWQGPDVGKVSKAGVNVCPVVGAWN